MHPVLQTSQKHVLPGATNCYLSSLPPATHSSVCTCSHTDMHVYTYMYLCTHVYGEVEWPVCIRWNSAPHSIADTLRTAVNVPHGHPQARPTRAFEECILWALCNMLHWLYPQLIITWTYMYIYGRPYNHVVKFCKLSIFLLGFWVDIHVCGYSERALRQNQHVARL